MSLQERFAKFEKVFPKMGIGFEEWKKLKQWSDVNPIIDKLDLSIFPDSLTTLEWDDSALRAVIIPESMTKLTALTLDGNHLDRIIIPETVALKTLNVEWNPLKKFKLGGSIDTLEQLVLPTEMPVEKVRFPAGLTKLKTLVVGSVVGTVAIPKDLISLERLELHVRPEDGKVKIPAELTSLKELEVNGAVETLVVSAKLEKLETLNVHTPTSTLNLPRSLPGLKQLSICAASAKSIVIPNALGTTLTHLRICAAVATEVTLPKAPEHLTDLCIRASKADITTPAKAINLSNVLIEGHNVVYLAKSPDLKELKLTAEKDVDVKAAQSFKAIEALHLFVAGKVAITLPEEMPNLETLAVPTGIIPEGAPYADKAMTLGKF